jgi:flavin reductase (DIM6/NTAB) family NADH-FMN oxidoreductase RutF
MLTLDLKEMNLSERQHYLQHAIAPRPICFASTMDRSGHINLSPFSFFNLFSVNPPVAVFSPSRRARDGSTKHTLENLRELPELVINIVDFAMVQQTSLASCEFPKKVDEFVKAGFTPVPATLVKPPMVKESKVRMEAKVLEIKPLGQEGGAGNLVLCEILRIHLDESILDANKRIDQRKLHHVARLGGNWYCRVDPSNLFEVEKPNTALGMGVDALPGHIRQSRILTGNDLGRLANLQAMPDIDPGFQDQRLKDIVRYYSTDPEELEKEIHLYAKELLEKDQVREAWQVLLTI